MLPSCKQVIAVTAGGSWLDNGSDTRTRMLLAAIELFAEKGFAGTTTREIADRACVNEVTIFRHFHSKEALFQEGIERYSPVSMLTEELQSQLSGDLRADLEHLASQYLSIALPRAKVIHLGMMEAARDPELGRVVGQIPARLIAHLTEHLAGLCERGLVQRRDFALLSHLFYAMLFQYVVTAGGVPDCVPHPQIEEHTLASTVADLLATYLAPQCAASSEGGSL